ncbi:hypothetical protein GCM10027451_29520 [Geodermatophilus aquaeductus]|uniref:Uncharacterized protein n=1 Tax=Geodermatophilus aquaeductus TaxID=1564161 RepID=A0A521F4M7_9ACTN|nr:hypothetical protein [Geodermatophilus aquaeductus]SMO91132.1 hypothetical protein SAMN06273567_10714 [Geodermatophilus aquaeductus]
MTTSDLVTGYELKTVRVDHMSGAHMATLRVPHAVRPGQTAEAGTVRGLCRAPVQQLTTTPWPPPQRLDSSSLPCPVCDAIDLV